MSIFDQFDQNFLKGDKQIRKVNLDADKYEEFDESEEIFSKSPRPFFIFYLLTLVVFGLLIGQLLNLQITQGSFNRFLAEGNRLRQRETQAPRGMVYDQKGVALLGNDASFVLQVYPLDLSRDPNERQQFYENLSQITQIPANEIKEKITGRMASQAAPVVLKENIDRDSALLIETKITNLPGVVIIKKPIRKYQPILGLSQILGYVGKVTDKELENNPQYKMNEEIGKDGLEKSYQDYLKGKPGLDQIEVDSHGRAQRLLSSQAPQPGNNLTLSLDSALESRLAEILSSELESVSAKAGAAIAVNPKTGEVLASVSLPTYDNNIFSSGNSGEEYQKILADESHPMFNRTVAGVYPSGSTIKPLVAAASLQEGIITENTTINDPGEIKVASWSYPDWKEHGQVDVRKALAVSCNVFFYSLGGGWDKIKGLGVEKLKSYYEKFGLGKALGIDLPNESDGLVPGPIWKEKVKKESWFLGDTYHMAIGQGDVLVTPLQMVMADAAIANGGELLKPYLVQKINDKDGKIIQQYGKTVLNSNFISNENLQIVREGMRNCVNASYGSCKALDNLPIDVAAKTGTAQFGAEGKTHAWMIAFAPYQDPQIAIAAIVEGGGEGYATAGPVVYNSLNWYFSQ